MFTLRSETKNSTVFIATVLLYLLIYRSLDVLCLRHLHHDRAFDALFEQLTAVLIGTGDGARRVIRVRGASAGAIELCPAILAVGAGIGVAQLEFILHLGIGHAVIDVAQKILGVADELVTRIQIAPRGDRHVLRTRAAARDALIDARTRVQIEHIVVEGDGLAFLFSSEHILGEDLVLFKKHGKIIIGQRIRIVGRAYHRLHRKLRKAEVGHMEDVVGEIGVVVGEGAADVVAPVAAPFDEVLEFRYDDVIAAVAVDGFSQAVMHLFSAVEAEHDIVALLVGKVDHLVIEQNAVGGQRKAEVLALLLLDASAIGNSLLDDVKVHQRFSAEEVDLQISSRARVLDQEVDRLLGDLKAHQRPVAVVFALARKAVFAVEVAGVRDVQAQRLDDGIARLEVKGKIRVIVGGEQPALLFQLLDIVDAVADLGFINGSVISISREHCGDDAVSIRILVHPDDIVSEIIHHMDAAAENIQHDVVAVEFVTVYHRFLRNKQYH